MSATVTRIDVADLDLDTAGRLAAIDNAALDGVPLRHHTAETFLLECRDRYGEGPDEGFWLAQEGGRLLGYAALSLNRVENLDGAKIVGAVHPDHQRRGVGRTLLEAAEAATERPRLRVPAWVGTAGELAVPAMGYVRSHSHQVRRLDLHTATPGIVPVVGAPLGTQNGPKREGLSLGAATEEASRDYDLERYVGACPDELLDDLQVLREVINDAPDSGEFESYPAARLRAHEASLASRQETAYTILARHRATGEPAALTYVAVHELRPAIAAQEDTSVVREHRGRRLGLRLKLAMLEWLRAERPDVESVDTWNAPSNAPMIAINEALGCRLVAETVRFVKQR